MADRIVPGGIWQCKVGEASAASIPQGADAPMRDAVQRAFRRVTGEDAEFVFSGWSAELTEGERAVVEDRMPGPLTGGELIGYERQRQIEHWGNEHDDTHNDASLNFAAQAFAQSALEPGLWPCDDAPAPPMWPWRAIDFHPTGNAIGDLVKAGALIAAEIDRLQRAAGASPRTDQTKEDR